MEFSDYEEFKKIVGLIDNPQELKRINAPETYDSNGLFDYGGEYTEVLKEFLGNNPEYHVATLTSDSDDVESEEVEKLWLEQNPDKATEDFQQLCEDDEDFYENFRADNWIFVETIDNKARLVNRLGYYLCNGDRNTDHYLTEIIRD